MIFKFFSGGFNSADKLNELIKQIMNKKKIVNCKTNRLKLLQELLPVVDSSGHVA